MDSVRAQNIATDLVGKSVGGWLVQKFINNGKSAVVFESEKDGQKAALKIFDPELVEKYGREAQLERIERERFLIGVKHPNLVQIFDGGACENSGLLYLVMEFIKAPNLKDSLTLVPREKISTILNHIASAAKFLETKGLVHRDIKPENIVVLEDFSRAVLLDLGVLRPIGDSDLTDEDARLFVGTLRYSSPEFLLRKESDNEEGWRAVTFYQLGAVLHDLIMRQPLFLEFSDPFALLVDAVRNETPRLHADDVSANLVLLARNCLVKPPEARLSLVSWGDFDIGRDVHRSADLARERVLKRRLLTRSQAPEQEKPHSLSQRQIGRHVASRLDAVVRNECAGSSAFPQMQILPKISENPVQVRVVFQPSSVHELPRQLSIRFDCDLVDEATMAFHIVASVCFLRTGSDHGDAPSVTDVFRGSLESRSLALAVRDVLWSAIDFAQRQGGQLSPTEDAYWLDINQVLEEP